MILTPHLYRIQPGNAKVIEWRAELPGARWCFYKICDSPTEAKRSLAAIRGEQSNDEQMEIWDNEPSHD
jgi:hypothetical protein